MFEFFIAAHKQRSQYEATKLLQLIFHKSSDIDDDREMSIV